MGAQEKGCIRARLQGRGVRSGPQEGSQMEMLAWRTIPQSHIQGGTALGAQRRPSRTSPLHLPWGADLAQEAPPQDPH